jgi:hypothetical protein
MGRTHGVGAGVTTPGRTTTQLRPLMMVRYDFTPQPSSPLSVFAMEVQMPYWFFDRSTTWMPMQDGSASQRLLATLTVHILPFFTLCTHGSVCVHWKFEVFGHVLPLHQPRVKSSGAHGAGTTVLPPPPP